MASHSKGVYNVGAGVSSNKTIADDINKMCAPDIDLEDEDSRIEMNARQRTYLWGLWTLIILLVVAILSTALSVIWAILASDSEVYKSSALFSVIVNASLLGASYIIFILLVIPMFRSVYKSREDPNICTRSFYRVTLFFGSVIHIGTFVAGYVQAFGLEDPYDITPEVDSNGTDVDYNVLLIFRSVSASVNFFVAFCAYILIFTLYFIASQNPWRRCESNGHCVISCTLFNLLTMAVSIFFLLTLQASDYVFGSLSTAVRFGGGFLGVLCLLGLVGGLVMIYYNDLHCVNFIRLVWFVVGGAGCIAFAFLLSTPSSFAIATMSGFIGAFSIIATCFTGCYCYFYLNHGGRYGFVTRYSFACFRTGEFTCQ